jgi:hypothetical protein
MLAVVLWLLSDSPGDSQHTANDGGHASLVTKSSSQVDRLLGVVLGEGLYLTARAVGTLARLEKKDTLAKFNHNHNDDENREIHTR